MIGRLPPFGRQYLDAPPPAGLVVAIGSDSWNFAKRQGHTVIVLPPGEQPSMYRWPANAHGAVVHETGDADDKLLTAVASALLKAGCPHVVAIRHSLLDAYDARHFFFKDESADGVAA